ncbi:MAG: hypothetical protein HY299_08085 [Verrucomicrobia bacterium]|nr:hypothetical protein [Verrucomicrobiota bacterium]
MLLLSCSAVLRAENRILSENANTGTDEWRLTDPITPGWPLGDSSKTPEIEGYASATSVTVGDSIRFFVDVREPDLNSTYLLQIFRLGWYGGMGGRQMTWISDDEPVNQLLLSSVKQTIPSPDPANGLLECHWTESYVLEIPANWVSGIYVAKLTAVPAGKQSYIIFVVREDFRSSDFLYQASVTTWQAYNPWGGRSLYTYPFQALAVSFDRPYAATSYPFSSVNATFSRRDLAYSAGAGEFFNQIGANPGPAWEYNMVRWLEKNGWDVTYSTSVDTHERGLLSQGKRIKGFLSVGHDEYWSEEMRGNVEDGRDAGVDLGIFSSNTCYWRIHFAPDSRSFTCSKSAPGLVDLWRRGAGNPEISMLGVQYVYNSVDLDLQMPDPLPDHFAYDYTGLTGGETIPGLLGYEIDGEWDKYPNGNDKTRPVPMPGTVTLASTRFQATPVNGGTAFSTFYMAASGASVFAGGSMQWNWGLDDYNARVLPKKRSRHSAKIEQLTFNILRSFQDDSLRTQPITFQGVDGQIQGDWEGAYGAGGSCLFLDAEPTISTDFPGRVSLDGAEVRVYDTDSQDPRALGRLGGGAAGVASAAVADTSFKIHLSLSGTNRSLVTLYCVDWEGRGTRQRISLIDPGDPSHPLDVRELTLPTNGVYLSWKISGQKTFEIRREDEIPGSRPTVSGLFIGGAGRALFYAADAGGATSGTKGDWIAKNGKRAYGVDGFNLINYRAQYPPYAAVFPANNATNTFVTASTEPRALRAVDASGKPTGGRFVGAWNSSNPFTIDVDFADARAHQLGFYFVDWDGCGNPFPPRMERVDALDPHTGEVLDTRFLPQEGSDFCQGTYLIWNIRGRVRFRFSPENASKAIVSAIFFDPDPAPVLSLELLGKPALSALNGGIALKWSAIPGRRYQIQSISSVFPLPVWTDIGEPVVAQRRTEEYTHSASDPADSSFYRVLLLP